MPSQLKYDCPHCGLRNGAFDLAHVSGLRSERADGFDYHTVMLASQCHTCHGLVVAIYRSKEPQQIASRSHPVNWVPDSAHFRQDFFLRSIHPQRGANPVSRHVPEGVAFAYSEAEDAFLSGNAWGPAAMGYRNVLELATLELGATTGTLNNRIDKLFADGRLTEDLRDWAHEIRLDGNSAAHDPLDRGQRQLVAKELREFVTIFLQFVFELPGRITERRKPAAPAQQTMPGPAA